MKFLIVAAKTGGHVFPASAIAKSLVKNNYEVVFIGTGAEIEKNAYGANAKCKKIDTQFYIRASILHTKPFLHSRAF